MPLQHKQGKDRTGLCSTADPTWLSDMAALLCRGSTGPSFDYAKARAALRALQTMPAHRPAGSLTGEPACMLTDMLCCSCCASMLSQAADIAGKVPTGLLAKPAQQETGLAPEAQLSGAHASAYSCHFGRAS
jgi:hypothetical protein